MSKSTEITEDSLSHELQDIFDDTQGNILKGFNKPENRFIFFQVKEIKKAKKWFREFVQTIPSTSKLIKDSKIMKKNMEEHIKYPKPLNCEGTGRGDTTYHPNKTYEHISFTARFFTEKLGRTVLPPSSKIYDFKPTNDPNSNNPRQEVILKVAPPPFDPKTDPFQQGMSNRKDILGDTGDDAPNNWQVPFKPSGNRNNIDGVIIVSSDRTEEADDRVKELVNEMDHYGIECLGIEVGSAVINEEGKQIEHFGFRDGISHPLVKGVDDIEIARRSINKDVFHPHFFVTSQLMGDLAWANNGSFYVFRKLEQDVDGFWAFMNKKGLELGMLPEMLASKLVGRWKSGAPLSRFPNGDPHIPEESEFNDFKYRKNEVVDRAGVNPLNLAVDRGEDGKFIRLTDDEHDTEAKSWNDNYGIRTPRFAHIRKAYPRDDGFSRDPQAADDGNDQHRILRRGSAYGPLREQDPDRKAKRGLLFACFQIDLDNQFEFIMKNWVNNPGFPHSDDRFLKPGTTDKNEGHGKDLIIGQDRLVDTTGKNIDFCNLVEAGNPKHAGEHDPTGTPANPGATPPIPDPVLSEDRDIGNRRRIQGFQQWVHNRGGEYFFSPSLSALKKLFK